MFTRRNGGPRYRVISEDGCGLRLLIPRYRKTDVWIGSKADAQSKGYSPKGRQNFFRLADGSVVLDGHLAVLVEETRIEMQLRGKSVSLTPGHWEALKKEMDDLIQESSAASGLT